MPVRKITVEGRITIPFDLLEKYNIDPKKNDKVLIEDAEGFIKISKAPNEYVCSITGKLHKKPLDYQIGEAFISAEGYEILLAHIKAKNYK